MSNYKLTLLPYGENAILINWPNSINSNLSEHLLFVKTALFENYKHSLVDISNGYCSLLLYFKEKVTSKTLASIQNKIEQLPITIPQNTATTWEIPVCYDPEFGIDTPQLLDTKKITLTELIHLHSTPKYHVYCKGFLPGFLYLGGLPEKLFMNRKSVPNIRIPKNSVAIGGHQTGIYPSNSPGGWHVIGKTPISFFNINQHPLSKIKNGDKIKFTPISKADFLKLDCNYDIKKI